MAIMLPIAHVPTQHSLASTLALGISVLQEHSVLKGPTYLKTVRQEHTMMSLVKESARLAHLDTTVWDGQSPLSTTLVQVAITVQSTPLSRINSHARQARLTT